MILYYMLHTFNVYVYNIYIYVYCFAFTVLLYLVLFAFICCTLCKQEAVRSLFSSTHWGLLHSSSQVGLQIADLLRHLWMCGLVWHLFQDAASGQDIFHEPPSLTTRNREGMYSLMTLVFLMQLNYSLVCFSSILYNFVYIYIVICIYQLSQKSRNSYTTEKSTAFSSILAVLRPLR